MPIVAAATTTGLTRLSEVPMEFWVKSAIGVALIVTVVVLLRRLAKVNKFVLCAVTGVALSVLFFTWVYERNEPSWATPVVRFLAEFLPSKGKLEQR